MKMEKKDKSLDLSIMSDMSVNMNGIYLLKLKPANSVQSDSEAMEMRESVDAEQYGDPNFICEVFTSQFFKPFPAISTNSLL